MRASGSGAGCGSHWPLCNGEVVPIAPRLETIIEFTHRAMSGVALAAVAALWVWSLRAFPSGSRVRKAALASLVFLITEAALGAGLVLFNYVDKDQSVGRAFYLSLHLVNTQFLLAMLALTAWFSSDIASPSGRRSWLVMSALPLALLVSVTGAVTALGDTLFPASSLAEGLRQDLSGAASFLVRLRVLHPALAILSAAYFVAVSITVLRSHPRPLLLRISMLTIGLVVAQLGAGSVNVLLLAPVPMQITHLLLANLVWIALVLLAVEAQPVASVRRAY